MKTLICDNLLDEDECKFLINFYEDNKKLEKQHRDTLYMDLVPNMHNNVNLLAEKLTNISKLFFAKIFWMHLVKWSPGSFQDLHFDTAEKDTVLSSITYLNDNFEGGETYFEEGTIFKPKKGRGLFFDGNFYKHGVKKVENDTRYVVATWYARGFLPTHNPK